MCKKLRREEEENRRLKGIKDWSSGFSLFTEGSLGLENCLVGLNVTYYELG